MEHAGCRDGGLRGDNDAGNHDSPDRLQFGSTLLGKNGLHVVGRLDGDLAPIPIERNGNAGFICPVTFADPATAREHLNDATITTHEAALRAIAGRFRALLPAGAASVLVAHAYVAGGSPSDSERTLSVGGADKVAADCFDGFSYTALGHLHRPQDVISPRVRYSGSLLKLSRSEAATAKSVSLVEIGADGACVVSELPLLGGSCIDRVSQRRQSSGRARIGRRTSGIAQSILPGSSPEPDDYLLPYAAPGLVPKAILVDRLLARRFRAPGLVPKAILVDRLLARRLCAPSLVPEAILVDRLLARRFRAPGLVPKAILVDCLLARRFRAPSLVSEAILQNRLLTRRVRAPSLVPEAITCR